MLIPLSPVLVPHEKPKSWNLPELICISMIFHDFPWFSMIFHDFPCLYHNIIYHIHPSGFVTRVVVLGHVPCIWTYLNQLGEHIQIEIQVMELREETRRHTWVEHHWTESNWSNRLHPPSPSAYLHLCTGLDHTPPLHSGSKLWHS